MSTGGSGGDQSSWPAGSKYVVREDSGFRLVLDQPRSWWIVMGILAALAIPFPILMLDGAPPAVQAFGGLFAVPCLVWPFTWRRVTVDASTKQIVITRLLGRRTYAFDAIDEIVDGSRERRARAPETGDDLTLVFYTVSCAIGGKKILVNESTDRKAIARLKATLQDLTGKRRIT